MSKFIVLAVLAQSAFAEEGCKNAADFFGVSENTWPHCQNECRANLDSGCMDKISLDGKNNAIEREAIALDCLLKDDCPGFNYFIGSNDAQTGWVRLRTGECKQSNWGLNRKVNNGNGKIDYYYNKDSQAERRRAYAEESCFCIKEQGLVNEAREKHENYQGQVSQANQGISNSKQAIDTHNGQIDELNGKVDDVEANINENLEAQKGHHEDVNELREKQEANQKRINELREQLEAAEQQDKELDSQIGDKNDAIEQLGDELDDHKDDLDSHNQTIGETEDKIEHHKKEIDRHVSARDQAAESIEVVQARIAELLRANPICHAVEESDTGFIQNAMHVQRK